jgi:hypothetical protein
MIKAAEFHVDQSPLDLRLSPQAPGADSSVPWDVIAESGGKRAPVTNLHGRATIVGPDGQQQSAPLTPNGDHLTLTAQPWASGDYQISVSVAGDLAGKPFQTQRDTVTHWTVPPRVTVDSFEQSDLGLIWTADQLLPTQALRVSSNSDAPITLAASTDDPSLQVTLSQATIPPLATNYPIEVQPGFVSIPDEGSHGVSLDIRASQPADNTIAVAPAQPFVGAIHYTRPGLAARLLHDFGGLIAFGPVAADRSHRRVFRLAFAGAGCGCRALDTGWRYARPCHPIARGQALAAPSSVSPRLDQAERTIRRGPSACSGQRKLARGPRP